MSNIDDSCSVDDNDNKLTRELKQDLANSARNIANLQGELVKCKIMVTELEKKLNSEILQKAVHQKRLCELKSDAQNPIKLLLFDNGLNVRSLVDMCLNYLPELGWCHIHDQLYYTGTCLFCFYTPAFCQWGKLVYPLNGLITIVDVNYSNMAKICFRNEIDRIVFQQYLQVTRNIDSMAASALEIYLTNISHLKTHDNIRRDDDRKSVLHLFRERDKASKTTEDKCPSSNWIEIHNQNEFIGNIYARNPVGFSCV